MNRYVPKILAQGVRAIVVLLHQGGSQQPYDGPTRADRGPVEGEVADIIYHLDPDVDVVVAGHDHEFVNALLPNAGGRQVLVVEPFDSGAAFAQIDLQIDRKLGTVTSETASIMRTWADAGPGLLPKDPMIVWLTDGARWGGSLWTRPSRTCSTASRGSMR